MAKLASVSKSEDSSSNLAGKSAQVAIPQLFAALGPRLHSLGRRLCRNPSEADDLVQETFLRAFRKWDQFEGRTSPASWLYTIATRICWRMHRRRAGEPSRLESLSELLPSGQARIPEIPSKVEKPDDLVWKDEAKAAVESAIEGLPMHFRLPLVLKDLAELSVQQVAQVLGIKEATVKTRVHRARLFLRKNMAQCLPHRPAGVPDHSRQVCLDLLKAKQEALDRGVEFPLAQSELCERCRSMFATLDLSSDICQQLGKGQLPTELRKRLEDAFAGQ